jgi:hypothetical protein
MRTWASHRRHWSPPDSHSLARPGKTGLETRRPRSALVAERRPQLPSSDSPRNGLGRVSVPGAALKLRVVTRLYALHATVQDLAEASSAYVETEQSWLAPFYQTVPVRLRATTSSWVSFSPAFMNSLIKASRFSGARDWSADCSAVSSSPVESSVQ